MRNIPALRFTLSIGLALFTLLGGTALPVSSPNATWYQITATNVTLPLATWTTNQSGVFGWLGNANATNAINPGTARRFFRIVADSVAADWLPVTVSRPVKQH